MTERMIFSLNYSRCGTVYLYKMMRTIPGVCSLHEPPPAFHDVGRFTKDAKLNWLRTVKLPYIMGRGNEVYIETSPQFARGWPELLLELNVIPEVIVIRRKLRDVALSLWRMNHIPGRLGPWELYSDCPKDPWVFLPMRNYSHWTDYQVCYWHTLDYQMKINHYKKMLIDAGSHIVEIRSQELFTTAGFYLLLEDLRLPRPKPYGWYEDIHTVKFNQTRPPERTTRWPGGNIDDQEKQVRADVSLMDGDYSPEG